MPKDLTQLTIAILVFLSSFISLRVGISVAIIEILLGVIAGNLGVHPQEWTIYLASMGGIVLTFLAGAEIDTKLMKKKFKESFLIGISSFIVPFFGISLFAKIVLHMSFQASLITGIALSTTSVAVVYSILVETGLGKSSLGKILMAATFITDITTAIALSILFIKPNPYFLAFLAVSILVIVLASKFSSIIFDNPMLKNKIVEPEIKYIFLLLFIFMYFAKLGDGHAVLPAFILGLSMADYFRECKETRVVLNRLRTVAYAIITPVFFIAGGLRVSIPLILSAFGMFLILFALQVTLKFLGVYFLAKKYLPKNSTYATLLMSTGLTFGAIAAVFGLNSHIITQVQYSVIVGVVVTSAVLPTVIAQKWFLPVYEEDLLKIEENTETVCIKK
ncbi:cation:proton antiporter [bacterium]|nr:cation:proton antiporter [bacterium]